MGLLLVVIKRSRWLIFFSALIITLYVALNAPLPLDKKLLESLRGMFNPVIPLISAALAGFFIRGVGVMYRMIERALIEHKKDIDKMINEILYRHPGLPGVILNGGFDLNQLRVSSDLCWAVNEVKEEFGHLWDDLRNHFPEVKAHIENFCEKLKKHEEELKTLEAKIREKLRQYTSQIVDEFNVNFSNYERLIGHMLKNYLEKFKVEAIENPKEFIDKLIDELDVKKEGNMILVWGFGVGVWNAEIKERTRNILIAIIEEYRDALRRVHEEAQELRGYKEKEERTLRDELKELLSLKVLPMKKLCKFI